MITLRKKRKEVGATPLENVGVVDLQKAVAAHPSNKNLVMLPQRMGQEVRLGTIMRTKTLIPRPPQEVFQGNDFHNITKLRSL